MNTQGWTLRAGPPRELGCWKMWNTLILTSRKQTGRTRT